MIEWHSVRYGHKTIGQFLGHGYGMAVAEVRKSRALSDALKRVGLSADEKFVLVVFEHGEDGPGGRSTSHVTVQSMLEEIQQDRWGRLENVVNVATLEESFAGVVENDYVSFVSLLTVEQHEAERQEKRRKELETTAAAFAARHNVGVATLEFIDALQRHLEHVEGYREQWNSGERRAEEWAAHRFAGSSEAYFDDLNYVNERCSGESRTLRDVLEWLGENCPLLMAKWNERQLATA